MFNWLFEGRISVYILLASLALVLLAVWWRMRQRRWLIAAGVVVALAGVYWLLDRLVVTEAKADRAEIRRRLEEMAAAVSRHDVSVIERNLSDRFHSPKGLDKKTILQAIPPGVQGITVKLSDIEFPSPPSRAEGTTQVNFRAETRDLLVRVEAVFDWEAEQGWRLREMRLFHLPGQVPIDY